MSTSDNANGGAPLADVLQAFRASMNRTAEAIQTASRESAGTDTVEYAISGLEVEMLTRVVGIDDGLRLAFDGEPGQLSRLRFSLQPVAQDAGPLAPRASVAWGLDADELVIDVLLEAITGVDVEDRRVEWYSDDALDAGPLGSATTDASGRATTRIRIDRLRRDGLHRLSMRVPEFGVTLDQQLLVLVGAA